MSAYNRNWQNVALWEGREVEEWEVKTPKKKEEEEKEKKRERKAGKLRNKRKNVYELMKIEDIVRQSH